MANKKLVEFIKEARKRKFKDARIEKALIGHGWKRDDVEKAFDYLAPKYEGENQVTLFLSDELLEALEKRANKSMLTVSEQIEDILRRSTINKKKTTSESKLDDALVSIFSRKKTGRKKK